MSLLLSEIKKIFIKNRLLLVVVIVLLINVILEVNSNTYTQFRDNSSQDYYSSCMTCLSGEYSKDKESYILSLQSRIDHIEAETKTADALYENNKITKDEYFEKIEEISNFSSNSHIVAVLKENLQYVKEDTAKHYFIDYTPWTQVFQNYGFDFLLMLLVLLISVNAVIVEHSSDMMTINAVGVKSRKSIGISKIITVIGFTAIITLALSAVHLIVYINKYHLSGWDYPIQSLKAYKGVTRSLSIGNTYLAATLIKVLGYCSFSAFSMFFAVFFKKAVPAMAFSLVLIIAPMYILNTVKEGQGLYLIPLPVGAMMTTGYIKGTVKEDFGTEYFFREITNAQLIVVFAMLIFITALLLFYISLKMTGKSINIFNKKGKRMLAVIPLIVIITFSGCNKATGFEKPNDNYISIPSYNMVYSKSEHKIIKIDDLPNDIPSRIGYISGDCAVVQTGKIISTVNLKTLEKTEFTVTGKNIDKNAFLGLDSLVPSLSDIEVDTNEGSLEYLLGGYNNKLYFSGLYGITEYSIDTKGVKRIITGTNVQGFKIINNFAYYINSGRLTKQNLNTYKETTLCNYKVNNYAVTKNNIYYTDTKNNFLYNTKSKKPVISKPCTQVVFNDNKVVCLTSDDVYSVIGTTVKKLFSDTNFELLYNDELIYLLKLCKTPEICIYDYTGAHQLSLKCK